MRDRIKQLAKEAGFDYDPHDHNFYSPDSAQWINKEIFTFADDIIEEACEAMEAADCYYGEWMSRVIREHFRR